MTWEEAGGAIAAGLVLLGGIWLAVTVACAVGAVLTLGCLWIADSLRCPRHRASVRELLQEETEGVWCHDEPAAPVPAVEDNVPDVVVLPDRCTPDLDPEDMWWVPVPYPRTGYTDGGDDALTSEERSELGEMLLADLGLDRMPQDEPRRSGGAHRTPAEAASLASADTADDACWDWIDRTLSASGYSEVVDLGQIEQGVGKRSGQGSSTGSGDGDLH